MWYIGPSEIISSICAIADKGYIIKSGPPDFCVSYIVQSPETTSFRYYNPLEIPVHPKKKPLLLGIFSELDPTDENIVNFTNQYGLLKGELIEALLPTDSLESPLAMQLDDWKNFHYEFSCLVSVWEWLKENNTSKLRTFINWESKHGIKYFNYVVPRPSVNNLNRLPTLSEIREFGFPKTMMRSSHITPQDFMGLGVTGDEKKTLAHGQHDAKEACKLLISHLTWQSQFFKPGDLTLPAKVALICYINERLANFAGGPKLRLDDSGNVKMHVSPPSLLGAVWMQFAQVIAGNISIKRCSICGEWEDRTGLDKRWQRHINCRERIKQKKRRARIKKGAEENGGNN